MHDHPTRFPQYARFPRAYDMPPAVSAPTMRQRMSELRSKLSAVLDEARDIEAEMIEVEVEGAVRDFAATWMRLERTRLVTHTKDMEGGAWAWDEAFDVITRSSISALPIPVDGHDWNKLLRLHTMVDFAIVDGPMMDSVRRVFGPDTVAPTNVSNEVNALVIKATEDTLV